MFTGLIATAGIFGLWRFWIYGVAFLFLGFVLAPSWRNVGVLTDAELTEVRYGGRAAAVLRALKAFYFGTVLNCMVLAMALLGATRIAEPLLLWNAWLPAALFDPVVRIVEHVRVPLAFSSHRGLPEGDVWVRSANNLLSILVIVSVTAFYSATGGLRSVVQTDVVQLAIMLVGTSVYAWLLLQQVGGWGALAYGVRAVFAKGGGGILVSPEQVLQFTPGAEISLSFLAVLGLQWLAQMNADGSGYLAERTMACRSSRDAKFAAVCFTVVQILFRSLLWVPMGVALFILYAPGQQPESLRVFTAEREFTYVRGISELLPPGIKGLVATGMLAALASTVDTHLNWGASCWSNDVYKRCFCLGWRGKEPSARSLVWVARGLERLHRRPLFRADVASGVDPRSVGAEFITGSGDGCIVGVAMALVAVERVRRDWRTPGFLGLAAPLAALGRRPGACFLADVCWFDGSRGGCCLVTSPEDRALLVDFYRPAPPPGFWQPVGVEAGCPADGATRLLRGATAVALSSASVFCVWAPPWSGAWHRSGGRWIGERGVGACAPWASSWCPCGGASGLQRVPRKRASFRAREAAFVGRGVAAAG
ncbi:MAG: sodium transporter [Candidatus Binatia bacterium]|nr:sodium transporter [Candidatus Binatia bacterium]